MNNNVVDLFPRPEAPHMEGTMICVGCQHEWEGVTPLGHVDDLECPSCHAHKGTTKYTVGADTVFQCQCGCQYFLITPDKTICANCGIVPVSY